MRTILPAWFDYIEETFFYQGVQFHPPMKTTCPTAENINETSVLV